MKSSLLLILVLSLFAVVASAHGSGPRAESPSGTQGPTLEQHDQLMTRLEQQFPQYVQKIVYGKSVQGRNLIAIRIADKTKNFPAGSRRAVLMTGATHGDEYLNVEHRLLEEWVVNMPKHPALARFIAEGGLVYVVPVFNPDGYASGERENANGIDLNRDFPLLPTRRPGFSQPETALFAKMMSFQWQEEQMNLRFAMDYHCCIGAFLFPWSYEKVQVPATDLQAYQALSKQLQQFFGTEYPFGTTPDLLGYLAPGTSKDFYYATQKTFAYTFEGIYADEQKKFSQHIAMWDWVFNWLNSPAERARRF